MFHTKYKLSCRYFTLDFMKNFKTYIQGQTWLSASIKKHLHCKGLDVNEIPLVCKGDLLNQLIQETLPCSHYKTCIGVHFITVSSLNLPELDFSVTSTSPVALKY